MYTVGNYIASLLVNKNSDNSFILCISKKTIAKPRLESFLVTNL